MDNFMNDQVPTKKIPILVVKTILMFLHQNYSININNFLQTIGLNATLLEDKESSIEIKQLAFLIDQAILQTNDVEFLLKLGAASKPQSLGIIGYMMIHSKNVYDALTKLCKYYRLISNRSQPRMEEKDELIYLYINGQSNLSDPLFETYISEVHSGALLSIINQIASETIIPSHTFFRHPKPKHCESYPKVFGGNILFNQPENILVFEKSILNIKTLYEDEELLKFFEREANKYINLDAKEELSERVSRQIILSIEELDFSLQSVAHKLHLHPRNLQKKLKAEQTSFALLLMEIRQKLALQYLKQGMEVAMVSTFLGYSELSSFSRAFKQWYGKSPALWLQSNAKS